jgi:hypothetical protein
MWACRLFSADKVLTSVEHLLPQLKLGDIQVLDTVWYDGENEPAEVWDYDEFGDDVGEGEFSDDAEDCDDADYGLDDYEDAYAFDENFEYDPEFSGFNGADSADDHGCHDSPMWGSGWGSI